LQGISSLLKKGRNGRAWHGRFCLYDGQSLASLKTRPPKHPGGNYGFGGSLLGSQSRLPQSLHRAFRYLSG